MNPNRDEPTSAAAARENLRWFIGVGISLVFGLFGMAMALLSYSDRAKPSAAPAANTRPAPNSNAERARPTRAPSERRR